MARRAYREGGGGSGTDRRPSLARCSQPGRRPAGSTVGGSARPGRRAVGWSAGQVGLVVARRQVVVVVVDGGRRGRRRGGRPAQAGSCRATGRAAADGHAQRDDPGGLAAHLEQHRAVRPGGQRVAVVDLPQRAVGEGDAHADVRQVADHAVRSRPSGW